MSERKPATWVGGHQQGRPEALMGEGLIQTFLRTFVFCHSSPLKGCSCRKLCGRLSVSWDRRGDKAVLCERVTSFSVFCCCLSNRDSSGNHPDQSGRSVSCHQEGPEGRLQEQTREEEGEGWTDSFFCVTTRIRTLVSVDTQMEDYSASTGIPMNCTFPVKNYSEETEQKDDVDALILNALRLIVQFGDDFIEKF